MPPAATSRSYSASPSSAVWQLASVTRSETPRCVSGMPAERGDRRGRRDARHDLRGDAGPTQRERLLAAAAEDERVASLQPDDARAGRAVLDEQRIDPRLAQPVTRHEEGVGRSLGDELGGDEPVVDEHVAGADELQPPDGDQPGIAGARADEVDAHPSSSRTSRAK